MSKISRLEDKNYAQFKEIQSLTEERDKRIDKWAEIVEKLEAKLAKAESHVDDWIKHQQSCSDYNMIVDEDERE